MEDDNVPKQIGKFKILGLVAKSMALVYKAEQDQPRRTVALKIPRGGKLLSGEARDRFLREVDLAIRVDHASVVPVLETGEVDGVPYYTMPFVEGNNLSEYVTTEKADLRKRLDLFLRVCEVVQALHADQLVHRDLKPENILIDKHGGIRLLDFGLAKALAETRQNLTSDQSLLGTLQFMAPEQTKAGQQNEITAAADVYSLGVILYTLLTDTVPYDVEGSRDAAIETIRTIQPEAPSKRNPMADAKYDKLVLACLRKDPKTRPQTAGEVAALLRAVIEDQPVNIPSDTSEQSRKRRLLAILIIIISSGMLAAGLLTIAFRSLF
jgi:serine/threonine-protein kinase